MRAESRVEMVVVGEESADSKVEAESRRRIGDEKCELGEGRLATLAGLFDEDIATASPPLDRCTSAPFPKTDMNDGRDASNDWEPVVIGMLKYPTSLDTLWYVGIGGA